MIQEEIEAHIQVMHTLSSFQDSLDKAVALMVQAIADGKKILICGNGGSAADAQHFAAEIVGRFKKERRSWAAVALTTDTSILTAVGNDYGFEEIFSRQVEGTGKPGDVLMGLSTSGNSLNVLKAIQAAGKMNMHSIGLLGKNGGEIASAVDLSLIVQSQDTARIQEAHIFLIHYLAGRLETRLAGKI